MLAIVPVAMGLTLLTQTPQASAIGGCTYYLNIGTIQLPSGKATVYHVYDPVHWTFCWTEYIQ